MATKTKQTPNIYTRQDNVMGVGYVIEFAGLRQHSVAWPDGPAERFKDDELAEHRIEVNSLGESEVSDEPSAPDEQTGDSTGQDESSDQTEPTGGETDGAPAEPAGEANEAEDDQTPPAGDWPALPFDPEATEADNIRNILRTDFYATNDLVVGFLAHNGMEVSSSQVTRYRREIKKEREAAAAESEQS